MRLLTQLALALPMLPSLGGWFTNRRNTGSWLCSPRDVALNVSDSWFCFINRVDRRKVSVVRDRDARFIGFISHEKE